VRGMFQRLTTFFRKKPVQTIVAAPAKPSAHSPLLDRVFAPMRTGALRSSLLAPRNESRNPIFIPHNVHRPIGCRGRSNRRKAQRLHRATR